MNATYENFTAAVKKALCEVKGVKKEQIFPYVTLIDFGVTAPEINLLIKKVAENFEFPHEIDDEEDIGEFFGDQDWKLLTVKTFTDHCMDLIVYKKLEDL